MKSVFFRVDASSEIGTGHLMRCLTLANKIKIFGYEIVFISKKNENNLREQVLNSGFQFIEIPGQDYYDSDKEVVHSDWLKSSYLHDAMNTIEIISQYEGQKYLIVDHYAIDYKWEQKLIEKVNKLVVIDDLADRKHRCDYLLDQNYFANLTGRYKNKFIDNRPKVFLGPGYAIFRDEFYEVRQKVKVRNKVNRILIFFGGSDPTNETLKILNLISDINSENIMIEVVVGSSNPMKDAIQSFCSKSSNYRFHYNINYLASLMANCDLCIGAGGINLWERIFLLLPTITISVAENQIPVLSEVNKTDCIDNLGYYLDLNPRNIEEKILEYIDNPTKLQEMSLNCKKIFLKHDKDYFVKDILEENVKG